MVRSNNTPPVWIDTIDAAPVPMERLSGDGWAKVGADEKASEGSMQSFLARCPEVLPLSEFSSVFAPATCIAREALTNAGPIDLLYMSNQGRLIIVETKLHKNPESRREVVAQVLDYADEVSQWRYEKLDECASKWHAKSAPGQSWPGLAAFVSSSFAVPDSGLEWSEEDFRDEIARNLRRGEILALIVGDQIRSRAANLVSYANRLPGLALELGLVELAFFRKRGTASPLLVVPSVVQRTAIVERVIVTVQDARGDVVPSRVERRLESEAVLTEGRKPRLASEEQFLRLVGDRTSQAVLKAVAGIVNVFASVESKSEGLYEVGFASSTCNLYWRQSESQTRRLMSLSADGKLLFRTVYLKYAGAESARKRLVELVEPTVSMDPESGGALDLARADFSVAAALVERVAEGLAPILKAESTGL